MDHAAGLSAEVDGFLTAQEPNYNADLHLLGRRWVSPGYHTAVATGAWVHATRESLAYAACLVHRNRDGDLRRATDVIHAVLRLQERRMTAPAFGVWPWMCEEPLAAMSPPDWNWADFCGNALLTIHRLGAGLLDEATLDALRASVEDAALSIFRRNTRPGYTNIAIMGGTMTAAAGELLGNPRLLQYGRERLEDVVEHTRAQGDFNEYNSPTYTVIALEEAERALFLVRDPGVRTCAEALRRHAWEVIAQHFHAGTDQWAGPHSRAYSDLIRPNVARRIGRSVGRRLRIAPQAAGERSILDDVPNLVPELPCPTGLLAFFDPARQGERVVDRRFWLGPGGSERRGYTWLHPRIALSSISADSMWTQRRGVLAYWGDGPAVFRVRALKDGRDFASMAVLARQERSRILTAVVPAVGLGDYHLSLDRPGDGSHPATDLVVRFSVRGPGARVTLLQEGCWLLSSGEWGILVAALESSVRGRPAPWRTGRETEDGELAYVEAVLLDRETRFRPADERDTRVVVFLEAVRSGHHPDVPEAARELVADSLRCRVGGLDLTVPRTPGAVE